MSVNSQMYRTDIGAALRYLISYIHATSESVMPAMILEYDRNTHKAMVQPLIRIKTEENNQYRFIDRPPIKDITIRNIFTGGFNIDFPLNKGDTGWLIAADRDTTMAKERNANIDESKNAGLQEPVTDGMHLYQFGFFLPDNWCKSVVPQEYRDDLVISSVNTDGKVNLRISISREGKLQITTDNSDGKVVIDMNDVGDKEIRFRKQSRMLRKLSGEVVPVSSIVLSTEDDFVNI